MKYVRNSIFLLVITYFLLFRFCNNFCLITPFFMFDNYIYKSLSIIILIIVELAIFIFYKNEEITNKLIFVIFINYVSFLLFNICFFILENSFMLLFFNLLQFYFSLLLNEEIALKNKKSANLLVLYIIWNFYLALVSISIFFIYNS